ncbi:MAG: hypothetical protein COV43_09015 [Deltaproteobacteria bacterium CG11_big_fil_rev_8_21_14_0_20_42_23]|nr:MAG: hypothetical protein COV43_09015 [Deltaproteobacteria bacterium CG11_big_fil_rev_8_21_14_0_20_42_23]PJC63418.1 MAG: hypothetical protein CO021_09625 [Deltaproteobacteria bacterium CG_4_9_14_0_2_um_filter_42_21]
MTDISPLAWLFFNLFIFIMLILDLKVFHRKPHEIRMKEALGWSVFWVALALLFNLAIYFWKGPQLGLEFLTGYLIEKSLSVDNIFVFVLIFSYFQIPALYQHKVLFWGIVGALVFRALFIFTGLVLIEKFHWVIYIFGFFLIASGIKLALEKNKEIHPDKNPVLKLFRKLIPVSKTHHGGLFFIRENAKWLATPLFIVLLVIETTDIIFALDSIPAILAVTKDPFIVYSSNAFAILGLRALYFALGGLMKLFYYLHYGLAAILIFVGGKMLLADFIKIPIGIALGIIASILVLSILLSLTKKPPHQI